MKRIFFITVVLAAMASATMSCGSFGGKKNVAETELDDSTKTAMEMERMKKEITEDVLSRISIMFETGEALEKVNALNKAINQLGEN